jgi:hypothetical protein
MKKPVKYSILALIFIGTLITGCSPEGLRVSGIYCENKSEPMGVPTSGLRFSWKISSTERNVLQTAYRLVLAKDLPGSFAEEDLVWDSGIMTEGESILVSYKGPSLEPGTGYLWRVRVWDNLGNESPWSETGRFVTGLESEGDWKGAEWIAFTELDPGKRVVPGIHVPMTKPEWRDRPNGEHLLPVFRREFTAREKPERALVFVSGLGHYELSLNGEKVGDRLLAPGWTHYDERCMYNVYDVTGQVGEGDNCLGMMLGNGFYIVPNSRWRYVMTAYGTPKMILMLKLVYKDGSSEAVVSNGDWRVAPSPLSYSNIYGGEDYNATLEIPGWDRPGFDENRWRRAIRAQAPSAILVAEMDHPVKVNEILEPVSVRRIGNSDRFLYDFGQNASGMVEITVSGNRGDTVRILPAELIRDNMEVEQRASGSPYFLQYILKGKGKETWATRFSYYGFRYAQIEGAAPDTVESALPKIHSLKMLHTRNSAPATGEFNTSFELFNRINSLILWAIRSNIQSVSTDCPHREKLGWLEQTYLMGESVHYNFDIYHLYSKVIDDMIDAQTEEGLIPSIVPEYTRFEGDLVDFRDSPEWGSASIIMPWQLFRWYGDTTKLDKAWEMMVRYADYLESRSVDHILSHGLGDWYDMGPERPGFAQLTPVPLTATAIWYYDLVLMSRIAGILGRTAEADKYGRRAEEVRNAFNSRFFDEEQATYASGSQTAMSMPLVTGLVEEEHRDHVLSNLADSITASGNVLTAGDVGYYFLVRALQDGGKGELLYDMNARDDVPGYGYQLRKGATALTESWPALRVVSNNHMMLGHLMEWFYGGLAGIRQAENSVAYKEVLIHPQIVSKISSASASFESPYGKVVSEWENDVDKLSLRIRVPANTSALVRIPVEGEYEILESGDPLAELKVLSEENGILVIRVGSGEYNFLLTEL